MVLTDVTMPSRSVMNEFSTDSWSAQICDEADVPMGLLPEIAWQPADQVARLSAEAAGFLGLSAGVPIAAGGGDDQAATLGAGAFRQDDICAGTGTSSDWRIVLTSGSPDSERARGDIARHVVDGTYIFEICIESTGSSLRWFRDTFGRGVTPQPGYEDVTEWASRVPPGADGLMFLPFVDGARRAPWYLDGATGGFVGLVSGHTRGHMARAVLEGIAFQYPATLDLAAPDRPRDIPITLVDGEAKSPLWNQIKADVMGTPIRTTVSSESAAVGAAILAGQAAGVFKDAAEGVERLVRWGKVFTPDADSHRRYETIRHEFMRTFGAVRALYSDAHSRQEAKSS
jgi:sugar (pentulose or hexulose) kinase